MVEEESNVLRLLPVHLLCSLIVSRGTTAKDNVNPDSSDPIQTPVVLPEVATNDNDASSVSSHGEEQKIPPRQHNTRPGLPGLDTVQKNDIDRLLPTKWLNDELINCFAAFYLAVLDAKSPSVGSRIQLFSSFLYDKALKKEDVQGWFHFDCFNTEFIVVPISTDNLHWYLAIICHPRECIDDDDSPIASGSRINGARAKICIFNSYSSLKTARFATVGENLNRLIREQAQGKKPGTFRDAEVVVVNVHRSQRRIPITDSDVLQRSLSKTIARIVESICFILSRCSCTIPQVLLVTLAQIL
ncbi:hypothetical protein B0H16DRAFT_671676 [Mycena metata]|uniref:Ubiquitin-like protease family profile domain-containing protein n=1 Tax=Mycena metata TaxID=1033252 RepID=A0AAD7M9U0_9AGAR|nr:hypothetical protein B0H16DRAFT_671676 [Mycena metata]